MTLQRFAQAERAVADLKNTNNNLLDSVNNAKTNFDKIQALTGPAKTRFDAGLSGLGITPNDFYTLLTAVQGVVTNVRANLSRIRDRLQ